MFSSCPIIFSGHNDRAVVALCRFFYKTGVSFFIIARHGLDIIYKTNWCKHVLFQRQDSSLTLSLFRDIALKLKEKNLRPIFCPTSEFLNHFVLNNQKYIEKMGWDCVLPQISLYLELSDKFSSSNFIKSLIGLSSPPLQHFNDWVEPCVIKPKKNILNGKVLYPYLCYNRLEFNNALLSIKPSEWFCQKLIYGQSFYVCAYVDREGGFDCFWQENLMQQVNGKSIVLARTTGNPGVDVGLFMKGLNAKGYFGPLMMELIRDRDSGQLFFIEVNPRFWGPLNLALKACPEMLFRFAKDYNLGFKEFFSSENNQRQYWYSWSFGASSMPCIKYPGFYSAEKKYDIKSLIEKNDVYNSFDTKLLFNKY